MDKYDPRYLDKEEKDLLVGIKNMDPKGIKPASRKEQSRFRKAARIYIEKEYKMNIRIDPKELAQIKARAENEGLKYQTLVKSVLHKYVTGQLLEKTKKTV